MTSAGGGDTLIIISWSNAYLATLYKKRKKKEGWGESEEEAVEVEKREKSWVRRKRSGGGPRLGPKRERAEGRNVWAPTWECDSQSEKARGTEIKLGTFFSQCH